MNTLYIIPLNLTYKIGIKSIEKIPIIKNGTVFRNFDFIVCDFIRQPSISNNSEMTNNVTNNISMEINAI